MENELRECKVCKEIKPLHTAFPVKINKSTGVVYYPHHCNSCRNAEIRRKRALLLQDETIRKTYYPDKYAKEKLNPNFKKNKQIRNAKYAAKHKETLKAKYIKSRENLEDSYLRHMLNQREPAILKLKKDDIPRELLNMVKANILYKRHLSKKTGYSISKINFS
jgi:hypothetical protein